MKYEKRYPRTEYGLLNFIEVALIKGSHHNPERAYQAALKLKEKGWTKSWYYQITVKPFMKKYKKEKSLKTQ